MYAFVLLYVGVYPCKILGAFMHLMHEYYACFLLRNTLVTLVFLHPSLCVLYVYVFQYAVVTDTLCSTLRIVLPRREGVCHFISFSG